MNAELASQKRLVAELQQQMVQQHADAQAQMQQQMMAMQQQFQEQMQHQMQQAQSMQMQQMQQVQSMQAQKEPDVREPAMDRPTNADNLQRFLLSRTWRVAAVTSEEDVGSSGLPRRPVNLPRAATRDEIRVRASMPSILRSICGRFACRFASTAFLVALR